MNLCFFIKHLSIHCHKHYYCLDQRYFFIIIIKLMTLLQVTATFRKNLTVHVSHVVFVKIIPKFSVTAMNSLSFLLLILLINASKMSPLSHIAVNVAQDFILSCMLSIFVNSGKSNEIQTLLRCFVNVTKGKLFISYT